jgi:hypothetical protein
VVYGRMKNAIEHQKISAAAEILFVLATDCWWLREKAIV